MELRRQLGMIRWRCGEVGVVWREGWDAALELLAGVDAEAIMALHDQIATANMAATVAMGGDVWDYQAFRYATRPALTHPYWEAAETVGAIQSELLRVARTRYRGAGKLLTATPGYRALLKTVRQIRKEIEGGDATA